MLANALSITNFGAKSGAADNTKAIQNAIDAARSQNKSVWVPKGEFKHSSVLKLNGVKISGEGDESVLVGTNRTKMAIQMSGDGAEVSNLRLEGPDGPRYSAYEACGISVIGATDFTIKNVTIDHSGAAGMHITGSSKGLIENNHILYSGADSIHMSNFRGENKNITVRNNDIDHPHDDGIAVVSYGGTRSSWPASHHILIEDNSVTDQEWGRGYTVVGGHDVTIRGNYYDNNKSGGAGIYIASEASYQTLPVNNVWVEDNLVKNAGGKKHAAIQVYAGNNPVTNVHIEDNVIYASKAASIVTNGSGGGKNIYISDNVSYGPTKNITDFVVQLNGTKTIESNNKILAKAAYPGDAAFQDSLSTGKYEPGKWAKVAVTDKFVFGTSKSETLKGSDATETINGKGGDDIMIGLKGHDTYIINSAGDRIVEKPGHGVDQAIVSISKFTLPANVENATVTYSGNSVITGNAGDNWIIGGKGNDVLNGGAGRDRLTGGPGNDVFVFRKGELDGDQVTDFSGNGAKPGDLLRFEGFGKNAKLTNDGDVWTLHYTGGAETFKLVGVSSLHSGDFQFI